MKNLLFIKTAMDFGIKKHPIDPPLGLMYLAAFIRKRSPYHNMRLFDMRLGRASVSDIEKIILDFKPDIVACSVFTVEDKCMHEVARLANGIDKKIKIIVGGPHPSVYYRQILKDDNIDIAVIGEGEESFHELLSRLENDEDISSVPGIAFRRGQEVIFTGFREYIEHLDALPFPAWDLIDIDSYSKVDAPRINMLLGGKKYMAIFTSRGCPYQCIYCHNIFGKNYRTRSPENVFAEIRTLHNQYNIDELHIFDDNFNLDVGRAKKICELIIGSKIKVKIAFPNGLRGDRMDEELIFKLKQAGTYQVIYSLETASGRLQKYIRKDLDISRLSDIIRLSDKQRLLTKCYCMIGFPTETLEEANQTIDFVCNLPLTLVSFFIPNPHEHTELYRLVKEISPGFKIDFNADYFFVSGNKEYEKIIGLPLQKLQRKAYFKFYLNPFRMIKIFLRVPDKAYLPKTLIRYLRFLIKSRTY